MIIYVDIDETICTGIKDDHNLDYRLAIPIQERIDHINSLYDQGHTIIYWTARGAVTGIDWSEITITQLSQWGCKYTKLRTDKPPYDLFIDDKNINSDWYFNQVGPSKSL